MQKNPPLETESQPGEGRIFWDSGVVRLGAFLCLVLLAALPYLNTLHNAFVYDDKIQVLGNPYIRNFHHLRQIFTGNVWSYLGGLRGTTNYYRPMMTLGYAICYRLFGFHAAGFHLANLVLNVGVVCLLFFVTKLIFRSRTIAFVTAALFAIHPIHTEAVNWIGAVTELELAFFFLLTFWLYLASGSIGRTKALLLRIAMALSFVAAILSKEQAVTLPALATVYEHFYREDRQETHWPQKLSRYGVLWLLAGGYLLFRIFALGAFAPVVHRLSFSSQAVVLSAVALVGHYLWKLVWPAQLCLYYVFPRDVAGLFPWVLAGLGAMGISVLIFIILWRRKSPASFGLLWLFVTLAPVLNVHWMPNNAFAERYLYLPSVGFCWMVAWAAVRAWQAATPRKAFCRGGLLVAAAVILPISILHIVRRNRVWKNDVTLFKNTLRTSPTAHDIRNNLGVTYWERGNVDAAAREWNEAYKLAPDDVTVLHNLGLVARSRKHYEEAVGDFLSAIQISPNYADAHLDLGLTYRDMGLPRKAELQMLAAVRISPLDVRARNKLAELYLEEGRLDEAEVQCHRSIGSRPTIQGYWDLGFVYWKKGKMGEAEGAFRKAEELLPDDSRTHFVLATFYKANGRRGEAIREYEAGLKIDPANSQALEALQSLKHEGGNAQASKP